MGMSRESAQLSCGLHVNTCQCVCVCVCVCYTGMSRESEQLSSSLNVLADAVGRLAEPSLLTRQRPPHVCDNVTPPAQGSEVHSPAWGSRPHTACDTERTLRRYLDATPLCFSPERATPPERLGISALAGLGWQAAAQARRCMMCVGCARMPHTGGGGAAWEACYTRMRACRCMSVDDIHACVHARRAAAQAPM